jgi:hypothetical protein
MCVCLVQSGHHRHHHDHHHHDLIEGNVIRHDIAEIAHFGIKQLLSVLPDIYLSTCTNIVLIYFGGKK